MRCIRLLLLPSKPLLLLLLLLLLLPLLLLLLLLLRQVTVRGYLLVPPPSSSSPTAPPVSSLVVPSALGSITCLSGSPSGTLLAAGTDRGALLVWDVSREQPGPPVFQVSNFLYRVYRSCVKHAQQQNGMGDCCSNMVVSCHQ